MKTTKFIVAIASASAFFVSAAPVMAADQGEDAMSFSTFYMSPVNKASQTAMVDTIKSNLAAKKGPCADLMARTVEVPGEYTKGLSKIRCEATGKGALFFGNSLQLVEGKPARLPYVYFVTEAESIDVLAAKTR